MARASLKRDAGDLDALTPVVMDNSNYYYVACKPEVIVAEGKYIDNPLHSDGNLVSGHAWPDLPGLMREFLKKL